MNTKPIIIPVAAGKGGVGKSFVTANLAIALAEAGQRTIAVDMDLGSSNLYSFLGLPNRFPGIGDFLKARSAELEEILVSTETSNLQYLPGDGQTPFMANIPHGQKIRLISHLVRLPADYIFLDLGAGTSFNTLDFFRLSAHGLLITIPEYPSIMSMLGFLKHLLLRIIEGHFTTNYRIRKVLHELYKQPLNGKQTIIKTLQSQISSIDSEAGEKVSSVFREVRPRIIFNMGRHPDELKLSEQIDQSLKNFLSLETDYFGFLFDDPTVRESVKKGISYLPHYRDSSESKSIKRIAGRIVKYWDRPVKSSAQHLLEHVRKAYEGHDHNQKEAT